MVHAAKKGINLDTAKDISLKAQGEIPIQPAT